MNFEQKQNIVLQKVQLFVDEWNRSASSSNVLVSIRTNNALSTIFENDFFENYVFGRNNNLFEINNLWPGDLVMTNELKFHLKTGKNSSFLKQDLLFHWITSFEYLKTKEQIITAMQNPDTGASPATTIALNMYLRNNNISGKELKQFFTGCPWKWTKAKNNIDYIQKTFYNNINQETTESFLAHNSWFFTQENTWAFPINYKTFLFQKFNEISLRISNSGYQLQAYNSKATDIFKFKSSPKKLFTTFFGIELELENYSAKEYKTLSSLENHAIFKRDGSLREGVEICTAPATLDVHKEEFKRFFTAHKENKSSLEAKTTCGMHIHIDKSKLSKLHIVNIHQFINKKENREFLNKIAGRKPNQYCQEHEATYSFFTQEHNSSRDTKYRLVNLNPTDTIELRMFSSTTNYEDFCKKLEFTQALVNYTRPGELAIAITKLQENINFTNYLKNHRKSYPNLVEDMRPHTKRFKEKNAQV